MISVITVTKNDSDRLALTIKSLIELYKVEDFQHIIVHGGEMTRVEKDLIEDNKKIQLVNEVDDGIYDAMNSGIQRCILRYVLFLNCGDRLIMTPKKLRIIINNSVNSNIICLPFIHEWSDGFITKVPTHPKKNILPTSHQAMLFNLKFIKKNIYNTKYKIAADFDLYHKSSFREIQIIKNCEPICIVQGVGVASTNSTQSYWEYLVIIKKKYGIFLGAAPLLKISLKFLLSLIGNTIIPDPILFKIRLIVSKK